MSLAGSSPREWQSREREREREREKVKKNKIIRNEGKVSSNVN